MRTFKGYFLPLFLIAFEALISTVSGEALPTYQLDQALIPLTQMQSSEFEGTWGPWRKYLALIQSGEILEQKCKGNLEVKYASKLEENTVLRSLLATMQFWGLKYSIEAFVHYAQELQWTKDQRHNLAQNLINTCSPNMALMAQKTIYDHLTTPIVTGGGSHSKVKNFKMSAQFPLILREEGSGKDLIKREAELNARLFRNLCSWDGELSDLRLLPTLVHNPLLMSWVITQMVGEEYSFHPKTKELLTRKNEKAEVVFCPDRFCRKISFDKLTEKIPKSLGQINFKRDLEGLYCQKLRASTINPKNKTKSDLEKWKRLTTLDEEKLLSSLYLSHVTGVPDLTVRAVDLRDLKDWINRSIFESFDRWAITAISGFNLYPEYEESMTLDVLTDMSTGKFPNPIALDLNLNWGEFDRSLNRLGKMAIDAQLELPYLLVKWVANRMEEGPESRAKYEAEINQRLRDFLTPQIEAWEKHFETPFWQGDLVGKVTQILANQIGRTSWSSWPAVKEGTVNIPVKMRFGPQALKYLRQKYQDKRGRFELTE